MVTNDAVIRAACPNKLKDNFMSCSEKQGRTPSSLLRDYMRAYVEACIQAKGRQIVNVEIRANIYDKEQQSQLP